MDIIKIAFIGITGVFISILVKNSNKEYGQFISLGISLLIFVYISARLKVIVEGINSFTEFIDFDEKYLLILLKMTGITYVSEFASSMCRDSGYNAIASQIEIFAKLSLLAVSLPVVTALIETISTL